MENRTRLVMPSAGVQVTGYYEQGPEYHVIRTGGSSNWLMLFTISGTGEYKAGDATQSCEWGDVVILPQGVPHDYKTAQNQWRFHWAHFIPSEDWAARMELPFPESAIMSIRLRNRDRFRRLEQAFRRIHENQFSENRYQQMMSLNLMEFIFILIAQEWGDQQDERVRDPRIERVLQFLSTRLNQPLKLEEIAGHVYLSPSRLSHLFKQETGLSVMDMFIKMRLNYAVKMLRHTSHSIEQIAEHAGFSSVYYFSSTFKKHMGISPSACRANAKE